MNRDQTMVLFIFSSVISDANDAAAPNSNPIARETASQYGFESAKK